MSEHENQRSLDGLEDFEKPKGLTFGEVQKHLLGGGSVRRQSWGVILTERFMYHKSKV